MQHLTRIRDWHRSRFSHVDEGATGVEYGLLLAGIFTVIVSAVQALGQVVFAWYEDVIALF